MVTQRIKKKPARSNSPDVGIDLEKPLWEAVREIVGKTPQETWDFMPDDASARADDYLEGGDAA